MPEAPIGRPFRILTAPAFSRSLTAFMAQGREGGGKTVLWVGGDGPRGLERGLRDTASKGGVLALMVDQHPGRQEDVATLDLWDRIRVPWPARLLEFLAAQDFIFIPVSARLEPDGTSLVRYHAAIADPGPAAIRAFLEAAIEDAPGQWNWSYPKVFPVRARNPAGHAEIIQA
jgi:lauroyl/myristoyl acyltransferase